MKITIVTGGSRGDVQPYVALGKGLRQAGHTVTLLANIDFASLTAEAGLTFRSMGESVEKLLQSPEWRALTEGGNFLKIVMQMNREMSKRARAQAAQMPDLCSDADVLVAGVGGIGGAFSVAEKLNIPVVQAYVFPITPTRAFPSPLTPTLPLGGLLNKPSYTAMRQMLWMSTRAADSATREVLGMPKGSFWGPFAGLDQRRVPTLYGYSRHVLPQPSDWDASKQVTGYWFLDAASDWTPPASLMDFLNAGPPPIYIGFGSMVQRDPHESARLALKALELSGQRGVIASGWGGLKAGDVPESVYLVESLPHRWLFPRMGAVVHHGGAGTTAAGLVAGVPSIVVPFMGDQGFWGKRVADLGVGTAPIPRKRLTAERLAAAITQTVTDPAMRQRAADLGQKLNAEDGIAQAVTAIERSIG